jgi:hypothetical protein
MTERDLLGEERELWCVAENILEGAGRVGITLRILGGLAFRLHCPQYRRLEYAKARQITDIDFAGFRVEVEEIEKLFIGLGYDQNQNVKFLFGTERRIFYRDELHIDVFLDKLKFCHDIDFRTRLGIDYPTMSLVDLLLEKLQIVAINEKDIFDAIVLIREHDLGVDSKESIDVDYLSALCASDWGLWKTVSTNLSTIESSLTTFLKDKVDICDVSTKTSEMMNRLCGSRKSVKWQLRGLIGDKLRWYREVEEVDRSQ